MHSIECYPKLKELSLRVARDFPVKDHKELFLAKITNWLNNYSRWYYGKDYSEEDFREFEDWVSKLSEEDQRAFIADPEGLDYDKHASLFNRCPRQFRELYKLMTDAWTSSYYLSEDDLNEMEH